MQINKEFLKSLKPCYYRYKGFLKHHADFDGSLSEFMELPNLEYVDKIWVAKRVLNKNQAISWATLCAESVVHIFEEQHPDYKHVINCINYLKTVKDFNNLTIDQALELKKHRDLALAVARASTDPDIFVGHAAHALNVSHVAALVHVSYCDSYAAAYAVDVASHVLCYAAEATYDDTLGYCDIYGEDAAAASLKQQALNLQFLKQAISA